LADWVEISTFFRDDKSVSQEDLVRALVREGGSRSEDRARELASDTFAELSEREAAIGIPVATSAIAAYPYEVDGSLLRLSVDPFDAANTGLLYSFLLGITRASMDAETRTLNGVDPTGVFEELCAETLCQFWGGKTPLSDVFVTGTSNKAVPNDQLRFPSMIDLLTGHLCEGAGWKKGAKSPGAGDGGLDIAVCIAVWRRFNDKRPGGLVGFAQCKTGDHWRNHLGRKNPRSICGKFFSSPLLLDPLSLYMVPCRVAIEDWRTATEEHNGILFDRCRIANFGTHLSAAVIGNCVTWLRSAIDRERQELIKRGLLPNPAAAVAAPAVPAMPAGAGT
jgi:hypothetical protein